VHKTKRLAISAKQHDGISVSPLVEPISKDDPSVGFGLPYYRPHMVQWSKVTSERLVDVAKEFALKRRLPVKDRLRDEWPGLVFEMNKRGLFKDLVLSEIPKEGSSLTDVDKFFPFMISAALYDNDLANKPFPLSKKGYRQFRYVSDSHLFSVAVRMIASNPGLVNISLFVKQDSSLGEELIKRGLHVHIKFERSGSSKRKFKRRPTKTIIAEIQSFVDSHYIRGIMHLRRVDTGYFRIYYQRKLAGKIKFHEKPKGPKEKDIETEDDD
jgi:hypothetical protein